MLAIRPIGEMDVINLLNAGRFSGAVQGYIMLEGESYLGHALYCQNGNVTTVLECGVQSPQLADGIIRACIAAGENRGAGQFAVRMEDEMLKTWWNTFCKGLQPPACTNKIFGHC